MKYGAEHFSVEAIDTANTIEEMYAKETAWIHKLNAVENGYNLVYEAHCGPEKAKMRWDRMTAAERKAANAFVVDLNRIRWSSASADDRAAVGAAMKAGWEKKGDRSQYIKTYWDGLSEEQREERRAAVRRGWIKRKAHAAANH